MEQALPTNPHLPNIIYGYSALPVKQVYQWKQTLPYLSPFTAINEGNVPGAIDSMQTWIENNPGLTFGIGAAAVLLLVPVMGRRKR